MTTCILFVMERVALQKNELLVFSFTGSSSLRLLTGRKYAALYTEELVVMQDVGKP